MLSKNKAEFTLSDGSKKIIELIFNLSKNVTWHADWDEVKLNGLRYSRGINYGLSKLTEESKFENYDAFLFLTNDTEFENSHSVTKLAEIMDKHISFIITLMFSTKKIFV